MRAIHKNGRIELVVVDTGIRKRDHFREVFAFDDRDRLNFPAVEGDGQLRVLAELNFPAFSSRLDAEDPADDDDVGAFEKLRWRDDSHGSGEPGRQEETQEEQRAKGFHLDQDTSIQGFLKQGS